MIDPLQYFQFLIGNFLLHEGHEKGKQWENTTHDINMHYL